MKIMNYEELDYWCEYQSFLIGADFQGVYGLNKLIILKFWKDGVHWLVFNLSHNTPFFKTFFKDEELDRSLLKKASKKPLNLFLNTHFKGRKLKSIKVDSSKGRVVAFSFGGSEDLCIEFVAIPGALNLSAFRGHKAVHFAKPIEIKPLQQVYKSKSLRSPAVLDQEINEFIRLHFKPTSDKKTDSLTKLKTAKEKIKQALEFLKTEPHKRFAEALETGESLSSELKPLYRDKLSLRENIDWGHKQNKASNTKILRLEERLVQIDEELKLSHKNKTSLHGVASSNDKVKIGRKHVISSEVVAQCGRSAHENLGLLRQAKPWHIWMHLKDYPSGHLILIFNKGYECTEDELKKAALFMFKVAAPKKLHSSQLVKFEAVFTEAKFVKPIKGAKKGLVQPSRLRSRLYEWERSFDHLF